MSNTRAPTKEKVRIYYETHNISLKKLAEHFNISENTIKSWKLRDKKSGNDWLQPIESKDATNGAVLQNKKKLIKQAKAIVVNGGTIEEAATKTNLNANTLRAYSAKENWMQLQEEFLQKVYGELQKELGEQHINDRKLAVKSLHNMMVEAIKGAADKTIDAKGIALLENIANLVIKTIKGQSDLLGIPEMKMYIKKDKEENVKATSDRTINIKVVK